MSFTSPYLIFSLVFFVLVLLLIPRRLFSTVSVFLLFLFLIYFSPYSAILFFITTSLTFYIYRLKQEKYLIPGIIVLVVIFILFKIQFIGTFTNPILALGYPIGLSYFLVRNIHFLFEAYKDNLTSVRFIDFVAYSGFFPAYFTGPIHRVQPFLKDLSNHSFSVQNISEGFERILYGYVKIIFLANFLVSTFFVFRLGALQETHPALFQYLDCVRYGANLYFLFAGYSDVAIGVSLILGIRLPENFNFPFLAKNINDFWKRWHISLSEWCRDYVFKPVFAQTRIFPVAIMLTLLAIGLWHEFSLRYIVWAIYHGAGIALWQYVDKRKLFRFSDPSTITAYLVRFLSVVITVHFVILSFCITKEDSIQQAWFAFTQLFSFIK